MLKFDIKSNVFIKIVDFGLIAFHKYAEQTHSSNKDNIEYMAPEVFDEEYNTKADIFSLGLILQQLFDINE
jgi:serine/threonine protein kinase